ncbi:MAG: nuclear transport factor 2 family protein [Gemmatimonadaceae bacterium]
MRLPSILLLLSASLATTARAQTAPDRAADSVAVIGVAQDLLRAISTRDTALVRRLMLPGAQLASVQDPAAATSAGRIQTDSQFVAMLGTSKQRFLERMWNPTVFLQGPLAVVRTPYDFHVDGVFSHCGVDVFTLVRSKGEWRVTHVVYTAQRQNCTASPLGKPTG